MNVGFKQKTWIEDWTRNNERVRETYLRTHGADEDPTPDVRVIDRNQLKRERHINVRIVLQFTE